MKWSWIAHPHDLWEDVKRYAAVLGKSPTPARMFNLAVNLLCARFRTLKVPGYPYVLVTDPTNVCNLQCPLCPTGLGWKGRPKGFLPLALYRKVLAETARWALRIWFFNWGEPLLHPDLFTMIREASDRGLATNMSTNLQLLTRERAEGLLDSGLDYLIVSMDGYDQESYGRYRRGGSFDRAVENLRGLLDLRRRRGSPLRVEWQALVMSHNQDALDRITAVGTSLGVDRVRFMPIVLADSPWTGRQPGPDAGWFPRSEAAYRYPFDPAQPLSENPCFWLYETLTVNPDGGIAPCCRTFFPEHDFGNVREGTIRETFNNRNFQRARALFRTGRLPTGPKVICEACREYRQRAEKG